MNALRTAPRYATPYVGRDELLERVRDQLRPALPVLLSGAGGVGKTRLAAEIANSTGRRVVWCELASSWSAEEAAGALLSDLGDTLPPRGSVVDHAGRELARAGVSLCVLDNLEQLGDEVDAIAKTWPRLAPDTAFLLTSRRAVANLRTIEVEPLPYRGRLSEAARLFSSCAERFGPLPIRTLQDMDRVASIVERLEGLPLAIELAAGRTRIMDLASIERGLTERMFALLRDPLDRGRHGALDASLAWSWDLLSGAEASAMAQISAFEGGFDGAAAEGVLSGIDNLTDVLHALVLQAWLRAEGSRFTTALAVRSFAAEKLSLEERDAVWLRHAQFYAPWIAEFTHWTREHHEVENGFAILHRSVEVPGLQRLAEHALGALFPELLRRMLPTANLRWIEEVLGRSPSIEGLWPGRLLFQKAHLLARLDRRQEAIPANERAIAVLDAAGDHRGRMRASALQGEMLIAMGQVDPGIALLESLVENSIAVDSGLAAQICGALPRYHARRPGGIPRALQYIERGLELAKTVGEPMTALWMRRSLGLLQLELGQIRQGRDTLLSLLEGASQLSPDDVAILYVSLGAAQLLLEGPVAAREFLAKAAGGGPGIAAWVAALRALGAAFEGDAAEVSVQLDIAFSIELVRPHDRGVIYAHAATAQFVSDGTQSPALPEPTGEVTVDEGIAAMHALLQGRECAPAQYIYAMLVERGAQAIREREARLAVSLWVGDDWFAPPGGERVSLSGRPTLARLVGALARNASGMGIDAMFSAGWPGETVLPKARADRVRVAVTTLRKLGLSTLRWERARGWWLDGPVRLA